MSPGSLILLTLSCLYMAIYPYLTYAATDSIRPGQQLRDWEQLISAQAVFRLGFFSPSLSSSTNTGSSGSCYLAIWYDRVSHVPVWLANQHIPVTNSSGVVTMGSDGKLKIMLGDSWVRRLGGVQGQAPPTSRPSAVAHHGVSGVVKVVHMLVEVEWFRILDRSLVGHLWEMGGKGLSFATMSDWVHRWWQASRCRSRRSGLGLSDGFAAPSSWRGGLSSVQCGGFMEVDASSADLGSLRLCVRGSKSILSVVSIRWGSWQYSLTGRFRLQTQLRSKLGSKRVFHGRPLGLDKAQRATRGSMGQQHWATVNSIPDVGLDCAEPCVGHHESVLSPKGRDLAQPVQIQINPDLNRVFASLRNRFEPRQTNSGLGASSEDARSQERGVNSQSVSPQSSIESVHADSQSHCDGFVAEEQI
ncbi:G-type lectin S-receptor-like serine/threonine-protein kinase B120 [Camellia lanceoleosa]|uniref:G-type lectin S-receptor-like serine/threonine-protein kinase B120 n=1 Tax=Camellia lanceoleosa TaxID=1840588 RepID=A0ACC0I9M2_9ERIC|nr:G-type lectin S-receptor-like serine/threonine-protein kinase B120 [Camellia lanceoleosa]